MKYAGITFISCVFVLILECPFTAGVQSVSNDGQKETTKSKITHGSDTEDYTGPISAISKCISNCLYHHSNSRLRSRDLQTDLTHAQAADQRSQLIQAMKTFNLWMKYPRNSENKEKDMKEDGSVKRSGREDNTSFGKRPRTYTTTSTKITHFCYRACFTSAIHDVFVIGERNLGNIAFTAHVLRDRVIEKPNETIRFDEIALNNGLGYDFKTGVFTCPLSGEYFFAVSINTDKMRQIVTELVVNDHVMMRVHPASRRLKSNQCSPGIITNLQIGEQVFVRTPIDQSDVKLYGRRKSTFMGFRIK